MYVGKDVPYCEFVVGKCKLQAHTHTHTDGQNVCLVLVQCPGQHVCVLPDGSVNHPIRLGKVNVDSSLCQSYR